MARAQKHSFHASFRPLSAKGAPASSEDSLQAIWNVVARIPSGQVSSYGDVARAAGLPGRARLAGKALRLMPEDMNLPWHRVMGAGAVSFSPRAPGISGSRRDCFAVRASRSKTGAWTNPRCPISKSFEFGVPMDLTINDQTVPVSASDDTALLWVLRDLLGMTGTKFGCGMALCGACTVHVDGKPVRSCVSAGLRGRRQESDHHRGRRYHGYGPRRAGGLEEVECTAMRLLSGGADHVCRGAAG